MLGNAGQTRVLVLILGTIQYLLHAMPVDLASLC